MSTIQVVNQSASVSDADYKYILEAVNSILPRFCEAWGLAVASVSTAPSSASGAMTVYICEDVCEIKDPVDSCVFVQPILRTGGVVLYRDDHTQSVAAAVSHEVMELLVDRWANRWCQNNSFRFIALDVCDPVQDCIVRVATANGTAVGVCNFILPAWSNGSPDGPYDHAGALTSPFSITAGGCTWMTGSDSSRQLVSGARVKLSLYGTRIEHPRCRAYRRANGPQKRR